MDYVDYILSIDDSLKITAYCNGFKAEGLFKPDKHRIDGFLSKLEDENGVVTNDELEQFGRELADALFVGDIRAHFANTRSSVGDKGLRVRIKAHPKIAYYPWELVNYEGTFLSTSAKFSLVRNVDVSSMGFNRVNLKRPLKILIIAANPHLDPRIGQRLDIDREVTDIENSLRNEIDGGDISFESVLVGTLDNIWDRLRKKNYNVIHFICHGLFDRESGQGYLALEKPNGWMEKLEDRDIASILENQAQLGLVVLNSCKGAVASTSNALGGVALRIVQMGCPSVIAMRYSIRDTVGRFYAREFYKNLISMIPIDENLQAVRRRFLLDARLDPRDFSAPVLFMNGPDGKIFLTHEDKRIEPKWAKTFLSRYFTLILDQGAMGHLATDTNVNTIIEIEGDNLTEMQKKDLLKKFQKQKVALSTIKDDLVFLQQLNNLGAGEDVKNRITGMLDDVEEYLGLYTLHSDDPDDIILKVNKINIGYRNLNENVKQLYDDVISGCIKI
jgi:CHAT domain